MTVIDVIVDLIKNADSILVTAGAGMGVDSGLPDFRGDNGFWEAYPALGKRRMSFTSIASPYAFRKDPLLAWGFYGHRLNLYRSTQPHGGYGLLQKIGKNLPNGMFIITSNVDGHFQKSGFNDDKLMEIHGSIHYFQCMTPCKETLWPAVELEVDDVNCKLLSDIPRCPWCSGLARPNILMFDDCLWIPRRMEIQRCNWQVWKDGVEKMIVLEIGAGINIPSIRRIGHNQRTKLIRINPNHCNETGSEVINLRMGALQAIEEILAALA